MSSAIYKATLPFTPEDSLLLDPINLPSLSETCPLIYAAREKTVYVKAGSCVDVKTLQRDGSLRNITGTPQHVVEKVVVLAPETFQTFAEMIHHHQKAAIHDQRAKIAGREAEAAGKLVSELGAQEEESIKQLRDQRRKIEARLLTEPSKLEDFNRRWASIMEKNEYVRNYYPDLARDFNDVLPPHLRPSPSTVSARGPTVPAPTLVSVPALTVVPSAPPAPLSPPPSPPGSRDSSPPGTPSPGSSPDLSARAPFGAPPSPTKPLPPPVVFTPAPGSALSAPPSTSSSSSSSPSGAKGTVTPPKTIPAKAAPSKSGGWWPF